MYRFPAQVDHPVATEVLEAAAAAEGAATERLYDLSGCQHFDSSLIAVLLELSRRAQVAGAHCRFEGGSENLRRLAGLYGVDALLFGEPGPRGAGA